MTANHDLQRRLADFYAGEPPLRAPDWVLRAALTTIDRTPQRRVLTALRRYPDMPLFKLAAAAAVVIAVGAFALWQLAPPGGTGGPKITPIPSPSPTTVPTAPLTPAPSTYIPPAVSEPFISDFHGVSLSYPTGWTEQPATAPWTTTVPFRFEDPVGDFFYDPARNDHLFLGVASQPLDSRSFDAWSTALLAAEGCTSTDAVTVDGAAGVFGADCGQVLVSSGGRGYLFWLYQSADDVELQGFDGRAFFDDILATVQLQPEDAVDTAPSPSP